MSNFDLTIAPIGKVSDAPHYTISTNPAWVDANGFLTGALEAHPLLFGKDSPYVDHFSSSMRRSPVFHGFYIPVPKKYPLFQTNASLRHHSLVADGRIGNPILAYRLEFTTVIQELPDGNVATISDNVIYVHNPNKLLLAKWERMSGKDNVPYWALIEEMRLFRPTLAEDAAPVSRYLMSQRLNRILNRQFVQAQIKLGVITQEQAAFYGKPSTDMQHEWARRRSRTMLGLNGNSGYPSDYIHGAASDEEKDLYVRIVNYLPATRHEQMTMVEIEMFLTELRRMQIKLLKTYPADPMPALKKRVTKE